MEFQELQDKIRYYSREMPEKTAIEFGQRQITYSELQLTADKIASFVHRKYSGNKNIVVFMDRGSSVVEAVLGVLQSGGVFIPLDTACPQGRLGILFDQIQPECIITQFMYLDKLNKTAGENKKVIDVLLVDTYKFANTNWPSLNIFCIEEVLDIDYAYLNLDHKKNCYIYFTSGSSGIPKAVLGRHRSLVHFIEWEIKEFGVNEEFKISQFTQPFFDPFLRDVFVPLCSGGTICIPESNDVLLNPQKLIEWIDKSKVTLIHMVPSLLKVLLNGLNNPDYFKSLKYILLAGEMLKGNDIKLFLKQFKDRIQLVNLYGPTETTLAKFFFKIKESDIDKVIIPVGRPLPQTEALVLDSNLNFCLEGSIGEVYIRTPFISSGYYQDKESSQKVFIRNPFSNNPQDIIYKTGDLGIMHPDGNLEIIGRIDHQVKIRGIRVEVAEIEVQLVKYEEVKEAVVTAREDTSGDKYLCAYIVSDKELNVSDLREYLSKVLPQYMIPLYFIQLDQLPLTANGKIDRKALPEPIGNLIKEVEYEAPTDEVQEKLVGIWKRVLGTKEIGINDNFFKIGGDSLKIATIISQIHKVLNVSIPFHVIFNSPTIKGLADYIMNTNESKYTSIRPLETKEYYDLSSAQKRVYILNQFASSGIAYNMPVVRVLEGILDYRRFENAIIGIVKRHEAFRTSFLEIENEVVQKIHKEIDFNVSYIEIEEAEISKIVEECIQPFDLSRAPLLRVTLGKISDVKHLLLFDMHHIISDGLSMNILIRDFADLYNFRDLSEMRIQYKDFAEWQNRFLLSDHLKRQEKYWLDIFKGELPVLNMPLDYNRPAIQSFEGEKISFVIDQDLADGLSELALKTNSTLFVVLLAAYNVLLWKYTDQEDIIVGSSIAGRPHADLEKIVGMFVNTIAHRNYPESKKTFMEFLNEVKVNAVNAFENQDYQFEELVDRLKIQRDMSRNLLYNAFFSFNKFDNLDGNIENIEGLNIKPFKFEKGTSKIDITLRTITQGKQVYFEIEYCTMLFKKSTMERLKNDFVNLLYRVIENPALRLCDFDILSSQQKQLLIQKFNDTSVFYKSNTLHEMFEEQVEKTPYNIALVFEEKILTYTDLNERANQFAEYLVEKGAGPETIVAVLLERSIEMIIVILGVLKCGAAYLPIDLQLPKDRVDFMLKDSDSKMLVTQSHFLEQVKCFKGQLIDVCKIEVYLQGCLDFKSINNPNSLACIIYTSGTTGSPKGVMIDHKSICNTIHWRKCEYGFGTEDNVLQLFPYAFGGFLTSFFTPIASGSKVTLIKDKESSDPFYIVDCIKRKKITHFITVPSLYSEILECVKKPELDSLKIVTLAGERITESMVRRSMKKNPKAQLLLEYGLTENSLSTTVLRGLKTEAINNIGKPISNIKIFIVDRNKNLQPVGVAGELCISGAGLARGYLGREGLTNEKFIKNPFIPDERMYRTGDLARWMPDGTIEYLGRMDEQVKIQGYRIELGDIETQLLMHKEIKDAVVIAKGDHNGSKYLCAYIVSNQELRALGLREYLMEKLPLYMIPAYFLQLDKLPLTLNGKIDRKSLPEPDKSMLRGAEYEPPANKIQERFLKIWQDILHIEKIGINDNFFEMGGNSLKATIMVSRIHRDMNVEIPIKEVFGRATIKGLAMRVKEFGESIYASIEPAEKKEFYPASSAQKRMYILNQLEGMGMAYNIPGALIIEGILDKGRFEDAFKKLIERHEALRTSFENIGGELIQRIHEKVEFSIAYLEDEEEKATKKINKLIMPFDLGKAPLLRVTLIKIKEDKHIVVYDMHHIISDGTSMNIIVKEFVEIYGGKELPALRVQYKDYAIWQNRILEKEMMKDQEDYWSRVFEGNIPVLNLPVDYARPLTQSFEGERLGFETGEEIKRKISLINLETGTTVYMVLLAAYNILLMKYTGQEDIIVGTPIAGRRYADLEGIIGMFVNTLAMRNKPCGEKTFREFLYEVKENALKAYENQDLQFEELVERFGTKRDMSRNPLFDVMLVLQNTESTQMEIKGLKFKSYGLESKKSKFDLTLSAIERKDAIIYNIEYCTKLFKPETIERMAAHYKIILQEVLDNPDTKLCNVEVLTDNEKQQILYEFNDTASEYMGHKTLQQLYEEQVEKTPENTAVMSGDKHLTYSELNIKANRLAGVLREKGARPDSIIAIMVERSLEMMVGIMGILKSGAAYLPISPDYPEERVKYMLEDSGTYILLTQKRFSSSLGFEGNILYLDDEGLYSGDGSNLENVNKPEDMAYFIYTSGSTGKPKGVMVEHHSVINLVGGLEKEVYSLYEGRLNVALVAPYEFDASVQQIFASLLLGHSLFIVPEDVRTDGERLVGYYEDRAIDISDGTPAYIALMVNTIAPLEGNVKVRHFIIGGEALHRKVVEKFFYRFEGVRPRISNIYGPTECTVDSTCYLVDENTVSELDSIPIGKPMTNTRVYILGERMEIVPVGIAGDIYISGEGVARGYLNKPELTEERFIPDPFVPGERMYKTGDKGKWMSDGNIEFMGRTDYQVKVRGYRIETGEIENVLMKYEAIREVVVEARAEVAGEEEIPVSYLCAYIVSDSIIEEGDIREHLLKELPEYMVPSFFVQLDSMPRTQNGKVDRKTLPDPQGLGKHEREYEAPRDETEEKMQEIWQAVLGIEPIGINDNFFEIGGHSLKAAILLANIHKKFNVVIPIKEIFAFPTIKALVGIIRDTNKNVYKSIETALEKEYYPASSAQKRLYLLHQYEGMGVTYNIPVVMIVDGDLNKERFGETVEKLVRRHEAFRTAFELVGEEIVQKVYEKVDFEIRYIEIDESEIEQTVQSFIQPFDLSKAPLFRVVLAKISDIKHILLFDMHHIISDGMSMNIMIKEVADIYKGMELAERRIQYKDFSEWQYRLFKSRDINRQEQYWLDTFKGELPVLDIPTDFSRPPMQTFEGDALTFTIDKTSAERLNSLALRTGATLYMVLLAAYNVLLSKYTGQDDIIVGSPVAGRQHADLENVIGMFVNTLAHRNHPNQNKTFEQFLQEVKTNTLKAFENQGYQFEELIEKLDLKRDMSRNPLFDTMLILQNTQNVEIEIPGLGLVPYGFKKRISKFDTTLTAVEMNNGMVFEIEYCTRLFKEETIKSLGRHFINILSQIAEFPYKTISEIELLDDEEKNKLLAFNNTKFIYPKEKPLHEFFEERAKAIPNNVAVEFEGISLTYSELNIKTNRLAVVLREKGARPDSIIAIMVERSLEMMVGIMGILKSGAAYLPISPDYPEERVKYMLEDSGTYILLTQKRFSSSLGFEGNILYLDDEELYSGDGSNLENVNKSDDLAYMIYTSGSTGRPKGVMIEHRSIINKLNWMQKIYPLGVEDTILQKTSFTFDVSVWELFWWTFAGAKICFLKPDGEKDSGAIVETVEKNSITVIHFVPSMLNTFLEYIKEWGSEERLRSLKHVFASGEALSARQANIFNSLLYKRNGTKLHNLYGPTEAAVEVSYFDCSAEGEELKIVPIGKPIDNIRLYILDKDNRLQPVGIPGELCISGIGVGRGYLNKEELTKEKFVEDPFKDGERMYRTGDLARWMSDGNIEYLGRMDNQVKIRGYRIELGEIEAQLLKHETVKEAVVAVKEHTDEDKMLCAYVVSNEALDISELRKSMQKELPDYMVPAFIMKLDNLPLTHSGKVDRKALPDPQENLSDSEYEGPANEMEAELIKIWMEVLGIERIGVNDNFFMLGGHSLKATKFITLAYKRLQTRIPLKVIFERPTIRELSGYIEQNDHTYSPIQKVETRPYYHASSSQKRFFLVYQSKNDDISYNMPFILKIEGNLDRERFETAIKGLVERHETLRTSFEIVEGEVVQKINSDANFDIEFSTIAESEVEKSMALFVRPFDLTKGPLIRVTLAKLTDMKHILMIDIHHIICDGVSINILISEFIKLYNGEKLTELRIQYKDFAEWQKELLRSEEREKQEKYWHEKFSGIIPVLDLPTDYPRPGKKGTEGSKIKYELDNVLTSQLYEMAIEYETTIYMILLAAFNILLSKYTGQQDIVIGTPSAGRIHPDLQNVIGLFVNTLPMRNSMTNNKAFNEFLREVKENTLAALENQDYQFEELVVSLGIKTDMSRNPLFDVMFMLQNFNQVLKESTDLIFTEYDYQKSTSKFDLNLIVSEGNENLILVWEYSVRLFKEETIQNFIRSYEHILKEIIQNPGVTISQIDLSKEEKQRIIFDFNDDLEYAK